MIVEFDSLSHTYKLSGTVISSVTQILTDMGLIDTSFHQEAHAIRGRACHAAILYHLQGDLDESNIDDRIKPYLSAFKLFESHVRLKPVMGLVEKPMIHESLMFAGTPDIPCELNGIPSLIDLKTGSVLPVHSLQLAAYKILLRDVEHFEVVKRYVLQLKNDGTYLLREFNDKNDERIWLSCLAIYNWKQINGGKNGNGDGKGNKGSR